ncbi:WbqC family protein [Acinetobacter pittii]|uniref:WbqC family protein n=1 Tax=Acinetobacter pittii TaxID=48296 RepID=UPI00270BFC34|nr:WbqC family protein [Acinetobacter pittii]MDO7537545.1 WbqC family protein [Acinetobacter pittii]
MKLAIMQPYFMPYIGYFQLINTVDKFIFYDDVTFIKQGWINRNQILINNQASLFSIPLSNASSHVLIKDVLVTEKAYDKWKKSFLNSILFSYKKAKNYETISNLIHSILEQQPKTISELAIKSIIEVSRYLGIETEFEVSSKRYQNTYLSGQDRVLDICKSENALTYINPIGGVELYSKNVFLQHGVELFFIQSCKSIYKQFAGEFVPFLSIIDVMMFNDVEEIQEQLKHFHLV